MNIIKKYRNLCVIFKKFLSTQVNSQFLPFDSIPGPKGLPLIHNIWRYLPIIGDYKPDTLFENAQFNRKHYGTIVREKITSKHTILHLLDSYDIESLFRQDGKYPHRRSHRALLKYRNDRPELYSDGGLFPENGLNWYKQRNQFQQRLLSKSQVITNMSNFNKLSEKTLDWIELYNKNSNGSFNIDNFEQIIYKWALGNSLSLFLNVDIDFFDDQYINKFLQVLHNSLSAIDKTEIQSDKWIEKPDKCPHYKLLSNSQEFLYNFVSNQVNNPTNNGFSGSYLNNWLYVDKIDKKDVITFIIDALMAGLHTTSYTIAFLLYNISKDCSIQNRLFHEIKQNLIDNNQIISFNDIEKLNLLRDCLKETFRLNPVSIGTGRLITQENLCIRNYLIPKNTMVITQNQVISRDESVYNNPETFDPSRWSKYRSLPRHERPSPFATLPFGFGARACIGQRIAELQIKIFTAKLLQKYKISFNDKIPVKTTLIHNIGGPISVGFEARS